MTQKDLHHKVIAMQAKIDVLETENNELRHIIETQNEKTALYTTIAQNMLDMVSLTDMEGNFIFAGKAHETLGYDADFLTGRNIMDFVHPQDLPRVLEKYNNARTTGNSDKVEYRYLSKDGSYLWLETAGKILTDKNGIPQKIIFNTRNVTHRKKFEEALGANKARQDKMLANIGDVIVIIDQDGINRYKSPNIEKWFGWKPEEVVGVSTWDNVHPDDLAPARKFIFDLMDKPGAIGTSQHRYRCRDGSYKWIEFSAVNLLHDPDIQGIIGNYHDITQRRQSEDALRKSEKKYRLIAENMSDVISVLDLDLKLTYVSPSITRLTGYTVEEALQHSMEDILTAESYQEVLEIFEEERQLEASGTADPNRMRTVEIQQNKQDVSIVWVEAACSFIRDKEQRPTGILIISRDITERKQAEAERERLMAAIEHIGEVIMITDPEGAIQYINPAFERVTGYTEAEAIGQNPSLLESGHQSEMFYQQLWSTISSGRIWSGRMINKKKDGSLYTEDVTISPVYDTAGRIINYIAAKRDITEHLRVSAQLQQAQKMESVGRLAGGVAHDFNNMLGVILGQTEMALEEMDTAQPLFANLQEVHKAAERSADLTRQLLTFARKQTIAPKVIDINKTVEGMLKILRRLIGEDMDLHWKPGRNLGPVKVDPSQIDQLLANLCVNARDAISGVGKITIETDNIVFGEAWCADHPGSVPGDYVLLAVSDNGCGMDRETLSHLFEPFFTTKEIGKGTGLGLASVYGMVKQNNGFINVYSEPGQGTTFKVYLPRHAAKSAHLPENGPDLPVARGHETILLVEDEQAILKMTAIMLERLGYTVLAAATPSDAIRLAHEHTGEIHMLMTDVVMPEMNGWDLSGNLLSIYPDLKRLFMSGYTADVIAHHGVLDEGVYFIQKPFSRVALAKKVREALGMDLPAGKTAFVQK